MALVLTVSTLLFPLAARAGRNCEAQAPDAEQTQKALRLATQVRQAVESSSARLVLLGRIGSDQSKRGVRYTHVGYLLREHPAGAWTVVHELNACGTGNADLFDEGLSNFYLDDPFEYETQIVIPSPSIQEKLIPLLTGPAKRSVYEATYSSIANPWSTQYQNSNGWVLEILAIALGGPGEIRNRAQAQDWLKNNGYQPQKLHIGGGERSGARLFTPNIRFGDHPATAWQTQTYEVSTGDSTINFFRNIDPEARTLTLRLDANAVLAPKLVPAPAPVVSNTVKNEPVSAPNSAASTPAASNQTRAQLLQSMQGMIVSYACRPQGYLNQCRQMEYRACEKQVSDAVVRCFATVSDQQLVGGSEQAALQSMQEVGYCSVESVETSLAASGKPARTAQGKLCPSLRDYK